MSDEVHDLIVKAADKYGVDRKLALSLAMAESNGNQNDISEAGAIGVMQLMPETARGLGVDPYDMAQNIDGGVKYLKQQLDAVGGDWQKAAAAYNAGLGAVQKYGGIPPFGETQAYVKRIGGYLNNAPTDDSGAGGQPQQQDIDLNAIAKPYIGQRMPNGELGCVDAVVRIGSGYNDFLKDQYDKNIAYVPTLIENAQKAGVDVIPFDASKLEKGDVIVYDGRETDQHVMIYDGNGGVVGNSTSRQQVVTQSSYDYAPDQLKPSRIIKTGVNNQGTGQSYSNPTTQTQEQAQQQNEQSATKPLFDINAEDDGSQRTLEMYNKFVEKFTNTAQGQQAAEVQNFFSTENGMLNRRGEFINNAENRAKIREEYPEELTDFANEYFTKSETPSTTSTSPVEARQTPQTINNTQQQKTTPQTPNLDSLKYAQTQGVNKWIRRLQRALNVAQEPVSKSVDRRRVQAMAHQILADELGIKLPEKITPYLQEGAEKAINAAHKELDGAGVFKLMTTCKINQKITEKPVNVSKRKKILTVNLQMNRQGVKMFTMQSATLKISVNVKN